MNRTFSIITAMALIALVSSCGTSNQGHSEAAAGFSTVSAEIVALPLIPVALPFNVLHEAHERKLEKQLQDALDPVYEKRITMIQKRDPTADAREAWLSGARVFLPSMPRGSLFPGLENTEFNLNVQFGAGNYTRLQQNEFTRYLETLMEDDPVQVQNFKLPYFSETYKRFIHVCWKYREGFNKEIYRRQMSSDKTLRPTATAPSVLSDR